MLFAIALAYLLLCLRIRVRMDVSFANGRGLASFAVGTMGAYLRRDFALVQGRSILSIRAEPLHGKPMPKRSARRGRLIRRYLLDALRSRRFERMAVHLRIGLGDACETAVAAGAVQALSCAMLVRVCEMDRCDLRVSPDFSRCCLQAHMTGIFSCRLGDIILAALTAARRKRKEGLKWTSIPLRA